MGAGKTCIKYLLFSFNIVFWLAGLAAVGVGIWMIFDPGRFNEFLGKYTFTIPASILIATGLFVTFVGFCGCWGAIRENKCMLGTYFTMLLLVFCAEVAAGVLGFLYRDKIQDEVTNEARLVIQTKYGMGDTDIDHAVDLLQEKLECCGAKNNGDYATSKWKTEVIKNSDKYVPESCCSDSTKCITSTQEALVYKVGCIDELITYSKDNLMILGGIGIGLACVQLLGMCFACCLFFAIEDY